MIAKNHTLHTPDEGKNKLLVKQRKLGQKGFVYKNICNIFPFQNHKKAVSK